VYKKGERTDPTNDRPISLLSIFDKMLVSEWAEFNDPPESQHNIGHCGGGDKILQKLMYKRLHSFLQ